MFSAKRGASCVRNKIFSFGYRNDAPIRQRRKPAAAAAREVIEREVGAGWGRHQTQQEGAAAAGQALQGLTRGGRGRQQSAAREVRKSAGGTRLRAGQKQARKGCGWMWCGRGTGCAGVGSEGG